MSSIFYIFHIFLWGYLCYLARKFALSAVYNSPKRSIMASFRDLLLPLAEAEFREFTKRTIPCEREILGVRIPLVRKVVQAIPKEDYARFLNEEPKSLEEVLARGFLIARLPYEEMLSYFDSQIAYMDNWCAVDTFCAALRKCLKKHEAEFLDLKVKPLLLSDREYVARAGAVLLLDFYVSEEYLPFVFESIEAFKDREEYYLKMAVAWLLAECYIKFPAETDIFMRETKLNSWTFNKAISKICDSYRVSAEDKDRLRKMRRK